MKAMKIVLAALAALMVLSGMGMADTASSIVSLSIPSTVDVIAAPAVTLTEGSGSATGSDNTLKSTSSVPYDLSGVQAAKLANGAHSLYNGLALVVKDSTDTSTITTISDLTISSSIVTNAAVNNPSGTTYHLLYTQSLLDASSNPEVLYAGGYTGTVTYTVTPHV